ncbi:hypothetical protein WCLP8_5030002 [uncultured Gammaproteobacteria bacterium]
MADELNRFEQDTSARDPDYQRIRPLFESAFTRAIYERPPATPAQARALASKSYQAVKSQLSGLIPQRPTVRQPLSSVSAPRALPEPKTLQEVALRATGHF